MPSPISRRDWLSTMLFSGGWLGLRMIASGLPRAALANPQAYLASLTDESIEMARNTAAVTSSPQFLILSASDSGEPNNCNVPGMYLGQGFLHPTADSMVETTFNVGTQQAIAAKPWADLGATTLNQTSFFHHGTSSFAHGGLPDVHRLNGAVADGQMMVESFAKILAEPLRSIQPAPINISSAGGTELLKYNGIQQPMFSPLAMKNLLTTPANLSLLTQTQSLRDRDLDALHALLKVKSTPAQADLIDSMVNSQQQARAISASLISQLSAINDNSLSSQMITASLLCQMKLSPVVVVKITFGGDNHTDSDSHDGPGALPLEAAQHVSGVGAINTLTQSLANSGLQDKVTFATLGTFGRSNTNAARSGRSHNGLHSCNIIVGKNVQGSVIGGADMVTASNAPQAQAIDPNSGKGGAGNSIPYKRTLAAYGVTLGAACGIVPDSLTTIIPTGVVVQAALRNQT